MRTLLLTTTFILIFSSLFAQQKLKFTYDTAGNQIIRERVCLTCLQTILPQEEDSLVTDNPEDLIDNVLDLKIIASPNPVTQTLFVSWESTPELKPYQLEVYTIDGKWLTSYELRDEQVDEEINFLYHPAGVYFIKVLFTNKEIRGFKVLKE